MYPHTITPAVNVSQSTHIAAIAARSGTKAGGCLSYLTCIPRLRILASRRNHKPYSADHPGSLQLQLQPAKIGCSALAQFSRPCPLCALSIDPRGRLGGSLNFRLGLSWLDVQLSGCYSSGCYSPVYTSSVCTRLSVIVVSACEAPWTTSASPVRPVASIHTKRPSCKQNELRAILSPIRNKSFRI